MDSGPTAVASPFRARHPWWRIDPFGGAMRHVGLGRSGLKVSRICLGMMSYGNRTERDWHLDEGEAEPIVRRAVEAGVTYFDTADMYDCGASEEVTGELLSRLFSRRDD